MALNDLFSCQDRVARWKAETENASARLELAQIDERCAFLISQHEPVGSLSINRKHLNILLRFLKHGNMSRLENEIKELI